MIPARGVKRLTGERLYARDVRQLGLAEHTRRCDHEARADPLSSLRVDLPHVLFLVEGGRGDLRVQLDAVPHAVLVGAVLGVRLQLAPGRVDPRPVTPLLEGELVAERGDVDCDAGVGVPVPGAPHAVGLVEDEEVLEAGAIELDRRADAREAGADHDDLMVHCGLHRPHLGFYPSRSASYYRCAVQTINVRL